MGSSQESRTAPRVEQAHAPREPGRVESRLPAAGNPLTGLLDARSLLSLQALAGNQAVGQLLQRSPPPPAAAPTAPPPTPAAVQTALEQRLADRYQVLVEATSHVIWSGPAGQAADVGPAIGVPAPAEKHVLIGTSTVEQGWPGIEKQIVTPKPGKSAIAAVDFLFEDGVIRELKALTPDGRKEVAANFHQVLIRYASDDTLTGTLADVDTIVAQVSDSFQQTYLSAGGGDPTVPSHAAVPVTGKQTPEQYVKENWEAINAQIQKPRQQPNRADELLHVIFVGSLPNQLRLLTPQAKADVSKQVFDLLVRFVTDGKQSGGTVESEWNTLTKRVQNAIEKDRAGYVSVREALLTIFGTLENANDYYGDLVPAGFGKNGADQLVHPRLAAQLKLAAAKLAELDPGKTLEPGLSVETLSIRENRNDVRSMSKHSFGMAVDVNSSVNPNIPPPIAAKLYPLITALTGRDIQANKAGAKPGSNFTAGLTTEQIQPEAEALLATSDELKASFANEAALGAGMATLAARYAKAKAFALPGTAAGDQLLQHATLVAGKKETVGELGKAIFIEQGPLLPDAKRPTATDEAAVANLLMSMYWRYQEGQSASKEAIAASAGQVARFGFLNLDPRVVASMAGSDAGALYWLGAETAGVKDFMHFEMPEKMPPSEATRKASGLPVQRAATGVGAVTDAGVADAGAKSGSGGDQLKREAGDKASKKVVYLSWTFDDGPTGVTKEMEKVAPLPATWFVMRNEIGTGERAKTALAALKKKQDAGQEIGIHSMHPTRSHVAWFPSDKRDCYPSIQSTMNDLEEFKLQLDSAGITIRFLRAPYGLYTEISEYLEKWLVDPARIEGVTRAIIKGTPIPPASVPTPAPKRGKPRSGAADAGIKTASDGGTPEDAKAIANVQRDFEFMKQTLASLGVHEWGGVVGEDPAVQGWEAESEPPEAVKQGLTDDALAKAMSVIDNVKPSKPRSLVLLAHDTPVGKDGPSGSKRAQKVAADMAAMEAYAHSKGVRIEYVTMSGLYAIRSTK